MYKIIDNKINELRKEREQLIEKRKEIRNEIKLFSLELRCCGIFSLIRAIKLNNKINKMSFKARFLTDKIFETYIKVSVLNDIQIELINQPEEVKENGTVKNG